MERYIQYNSRLTLISSALTMMWCAPPAAPSEAAPEAVPEAMLAAPLPALASWCRNVQNSLHGEMMERKCTV